MSSVSWATSTSDRRSLELSAAQIDQAALSAPNAIERRAAAPTIDVSLFRIPAFSGSGIAVLIFNLGTFGVFLYTSLYFQHVLGYSPVRAGTALLPWILMLLVIGPFTGSLTQRVVPRVLVTAGLAIMALGLLLLTGIDEHSSYVDLLPGLLIGGLGGALTIPLNAVAIGAVPARQSGVASGIFNTARETGGRWASPSSARCWRRAGTTVRSPVTRSQPATAAASRSRQRSP